VGRERTSADDNRDEKTVVIVSPKSCMVWMLGVGEVYE
jgi:hypothetical protein